MSHVEDSLLSIPYFHRTNYVCDRHANKALYHIIFWVNNEYKIKPGTDDRSQENLSGFSGVLMGRRFTKLINWGAIFQAEPRMIEAGAPKVAQRGLISVDSNMSKCCLAQQNCTQIAGMRV